VGFLLKCGLLCLHSSHQVSNLKHSIKKYDSYVTEISSDNCSPLIKHASVFRISINHFECKKSRKANTLPII